MNERDASRIQDMLSYAAEARSFVQNLSFTDFAASRVSILAVIKCLEVIGEAAYQLTNDARSRFTGVPWPAIAGMRHRLVHAYHDINVQIVWDTVHRSLPDLVATLQPGLAAGNAAKEQA